MTEQIENRKNWHETFGHAPAYRCEVCHGESSWRLDRYGDAVVSWACDTDLAALLRAGQRPGERTKISVMLRRTGSEPSPSPSQEGGTG
jgi:hypothetical protein